MSILIAILIFIVALAAILKGADFLIDGASDIATALKVPPILVGLSVVAFGTSFPEFVVSIFAALSGSGDFVFGNIIGSNMANIGLGIGISALIVTLPIKLKTLSYELPVLSAATFLLLILSHNHFIFNNNSFGLERIDALILLTLFIIFIIYLYRSATSESSKQTEEFKHLEEEANEFSYKNILQVIAGIAALGIGGNFLVKSSTTIAQVAGLSDAFIAATIVAIGTSLPDIITTVVAVTKNKTQMAVGNIVGSNIFNILFVLGTVSLIKPITINKSLITIDAPIMLGLTLLFLLYASNDKQINKWEGVTLITGYAAYMAYLIIPIL